MSGLPKIEQGVGPKVAAQLGRPMQGILSEIQIEHGPAEVLGPFFLMAEEAARERGVHLSFAPLDALREANEQNRDSWRPLIPIFDPRYGGFTAETGFCILGRNDAGEIVATQAARRYDLLDRNFFDIVTSLRLLYPDPAEPFARGERWYAEGDAATAAKKVSGTVTFSGAGWFRPDYRGRFPSAILPRISRALAYTRWNTDFTTSMMADGVVKGGFAQKCGYTNVAWHVRSENAVVGDLRLAFVWMDSGQLLSDLRKISSGMSTEINLTVEPRTA